MIKDNILKAREGGGESPKKGPGQRVESVMVVMTHPSRGARSRKRKREAEESSPSADAVSEKNLKETAPMILARWKMAAYKGGSAARKLTEITIEVEASTNPGKEEDFKLQKANAMRGSTSGQMWEVDVRKEWISTQHQDTGKRVTSDPLERGATRNTARTWWMALETTNELENCLKGLDRGVSRKRRNWATLIANPFVRTMGQLLCSWSLAGVALEALSSYDKLKLGDTGLRVYQMLVQRIARDNSGECSEEERCHLILEMNHVSDV